MVMVPSNLIPTRLTQLPTDPAPSVDALIMCVRDGVTYKVSAADLLNIAGVPPTRQVLAGTALQGGGQLSADITLSVAPGGISQTELAVTGVTAGIYGSATAIPQLTVDPTGRVTAATSLSQTPDMSRAIGILPLANGGTSKNITPAAGSLVYTDANSMQVSPVGVAGQVLVSGGSGAPSWGSALIVADQAANLVYAGPASGPAAPTGFRALTNADLPASGVGAGSYGSATTSAVVTVNDRGVVTTASTSTITPAFSSLTSTPTTLAGYGINDAQPLDATLTALAGLTTAVDKLPYFVGIDTASTTSLTTFGRSLIDDTTAADARATLGAAASGANSDITSMTGVSGGITTPDFITFDVTPETVPTAPGSLYWDAADGNQTLSLVMGNGVTIQQVGEEQYFRIKASAAITEGQAVMFTGSVGASGALTGAPASGLAPATALYAMGVATESIALNGWGYVTSFGLVRGIDTTGGAEAWTEGTLLYLNPLVVGGLTKTLPVAPAPKVVVAAVIHVSATVGSLFIRPAFGGRLGDYEGDVQITSITAGDLLQYNGTNWRNLASSSVGVGLATNIAGGGAGAVPYQSAASTTTMLTIGTAGQVLTSTGSAPSWGSINGGTF